MQISNVSIYSKTTPSLQRTNIFGFNNNKISFTSESDAFESSTISPQRVEELEQEAQREVETVKKKAEEVKKAALQDAGKETWKKDEVYVNTYTANYQREFKGKTLNVSVTQVLGSEPSILNIDEGTDPKTNIERTYLIMPDIISYKEISDPEGCKACNKFVCVMKNGSKIVGKESLVNGKMTTDKQLIMKDGKLSAIYENGTEGGRGMIWERKYTLSENGTWVQKTNVETTVP